MSENDGVLQKVVMSCVETVKPERQKIINEIKAYRKAHPQWSTDELADNWADRICWLFASEGAATALPGAIPGPGTLAQAGIESVAFSADLLYMLRCMAGMVQGISFIYQQDNEDFFTDEFVKVLGLWCGVLQTSKGAVIRIGKKIAIAQFKRVPAKVFQRINQKVGVTIVTKYGTKRGGIAIGKLVPFGVGALVGGSFNLYTMKYFKSSAIKYFKETDLNISFDDNE